MAQLEQIATVLRDIRLCNIQFNNEEFESMYSNDSNCGTNSSFIASEYQKAILSENSPSANDLPYVAQFACLSAFKCPRNHSMLTYPNFSAKCAKCDLDLSTHPCRHCNVCNYNVCLQCYTASPSDCIARHGLTQFSSQITHQFFCDVCGSAIIQNDTIHSCRRCDYDVCSQCYVPRTVLNNIDLNDIPLEPYKYDAIFANNDKDGEDDHDSNEEDKDEYKIDALSVLKFNFEVKDIEIDYNVNKEQEYIGSIVSEIDKIRDEIMDLQLEIIKKKQLITRLRQVELTKRTQLNSVEIWMKQNKLKWESFKLQWKEWNVECFIEFMKRVKLECSTFAKYYCGNDMNCKMKIVKYMGTNAEKFGNNIFLGKSHLHLFNELSLYRIGIINDKDCSIIYEEIRKILRFQKKKRKKKSSKKKRKVQEIQNCDDSDYKVEEDGLLLFLREIKLESYYSKLVEDGFDDLNALSILDKADLVRIGMKNGHMKKLLKKIESLNAKEAEINKQEIEGQPQPLLHYYISPK